MPSSRLRSPDGDLMGIQEGHKWLGASDSQQPPSPSDRCEYRPGYYPKIIGAGTPDAPAEGRHQQSGENCIAASLKSGLQSHSSKSVCQSSLQVSKVERNATEKNDKLCPIHDILATTISLVLAYESV